MTVFGDSVFKEVTKLSEVIWVGPNPMTDVLIKQKKFGHRHGQREDPLGGRRRLTTSQGERPQKKTTLPTS